MLMGVAGGAVATGVGCATPAFSPQADNPLGPSFWIIPVPSEDDSLLGRVFAKVPSTEMTLEEQSSPNPCLAKLAEKRESSMQNHYENAIDTKTSAGGGALLGMYGFSAQVGTASHLMYKISTTTKISRIDTPEYQACCKEKGCGWGYVASLVHGDGEYAAGNEMTAQAGGNYTIVSAGVSRSFSVSNKKTIKGYLAAIIVAHNRDEAAQACPAGKMWAKIECVAQDFGWQQEELCKKGNPQATDPGWKDNQQMQATFKSQQDEACKWLTNHGGPGTFPKPAPPPSATPAKPAASGAPSPTPTSAPAADKFEPGDYVAVATNWSGKVTFRADGTVQRETGQKGIWMYNDKMLTVKMDGEFEEQLKPTGPGAYANYTGFFKIQKVAGSSATPTPSTSASSKPAPSTSASSKPAPSTTPSSKPTSTAPAPTTTASANPAGTTTKPPPGRPKK